MQRERTLHLMGKFRRLWPISPYSSPSSSEHVDNQDADEKRMLIISQNGNTGEHYTCNKCKAPMIEVLNGVYPCDSDKCPLSADT